SFARIWVILSTAGKSSVRNRAIWPLAGNDRGVLVSIAPVPGSHNVAKTLAVAVLGLAMAMPVLSVVSVSAAKSVAAMASKAGSTPTSESTVVPDRNWRITVVKASDGK